MTQMTRMNDFLEKKNRRYPLNRRMKNENSVELRVLCGEKEKQK